VHTVQQQQLKYECTHVLYANVNMFVAHDHVRSMVCEVENEVQYNTNMEKISITSTNPRGTSDEADQLYKRVSIGVKV